LAEMLPIMQSVRDAWDLDGNCSYAGTGRGRKYDCGELKNEGVDATYVIEQPATSSNYSTIINYSGERTIFVYHAPRSYEFPIHLPVTPWVYLTSMGETFRPFYIHMVDWLRANPGVKLAFNPGSWQMRLEYENIKDVMELTNVILSIGTRRRNLLKFSGESHGRERDLLVALNKTGA